MDENAAPSCIFIDNTILSSEHSDEAERAVFVANLTLIWNFTRTQPVFITRTLSTESAIKSFEEDCKLNNYKRCSRCNRLLIFNGNMVTDDDYNYWGTFVTSGVSASKEFGLGTARVIRVIQAVGHGSSKSPNALSHIIEKAMTRGWNANHGVHLFGKVISYGGLFLQLGIGMFRFSNAVKEGDNKEAVKVVVGTSGGIAGGIAGAQAGTMIGSLLGPVGTVIGGILGGVIGGVGASLGGERIVSTVLESDPDTFLCEFCGVCERDSVTVKNNNAEEKKNA
eukprot:TRINITY_DN9657_c0_g1_i1.p1 TRINITY_DN9657_c0_g1~~TRINITY_DN9657_c0_g1_i1.p1  ORF type:complete len:281 (+),score=54.40 TRINITY_DN9657_c0_g1_i1:47-889(+)